MFGFVFFLVMTCVVLVTVLLIHYLGEKEEKATWVSVGEFPNDKGSIIHSTDGKKWKFSKSIPDPTLRFLTVSYGNDTWLAGGKETMTKYVLAESNNGIEWKNLTIGPWDENNNPSTLSCLGYGLVDGSPGWVLGGSKDSGSTDPRLNILYSTDNGKTWNKSEQNTGQHYFSESCKGIDYNNGVWIAVGETVGGDRGIIISEDGKKFSLPTITDNIGTNMSGIASGEINGTTTWVAVGQDNGNGYPIIYSTDDGQEWEIPTTPASDFASLEFYSVAYGMVNGSPGFVAVDDSNNIWYTTDAPTDWAIASNGSFDSAGQGVHYSQKKKLWVGVGGGPNNSVLHSANGVTWTTSTGDLLSNGFGVDSIE